MNSSSTNREAERGSALLIVFVFAAILAIMLYEEMPSYAFEARRQKEQLLIDRGNEYVHAIKLYYRKVGGFPASLDALENTNRMRFLRRRFKDPFTDKDNWRLLHMGAGFQLLDSKVNRFQANNGTGANKSSNSSSMSGNSNSASTSSFGSTSNNSSSFGSNTGGFTGLSSSQSSSEPEVKVPPIRQRGPAISASGGLPAEEDAGGLTSAGGAPLPTTLPTELPIAPSEPNTAATNGSSAQPNTMQMVQNLFSTQSSRPQAGSSSGMGVMQGGGGVAGVASRASGHSIKTVGDQDNYSLWEFYYDPSKDTRSGLPAGNQPAPASSGTGTGSNGILNSSSPATTTGQSTNNGFHLGIGTPNSTSNSPQ